jgi:hypothetical protein
MTGVLVNIDVEDLEGATQFYCAEAVGPEKRTGNAPLQPASRTTA